MNIPTRIFSLNVSSTLRYEKDIMDVRRENENYIGNQLHT